MLPPNQSSCSVMQDTWCHSGLTAQLKLREASLYVRNLLSRSTVALGRRVCALCLEGREVWTGNGDGCEGSITPNPR
jgi:hypothetical protein